MKSHSGVRLKLLKERYGRYIEAERAILSGQSYSMEGLSLTRADLSTVKKAIADLENEMLAAERAVSGQRRARMRIAVPCDALRMSRRRQFVPFA